MKWRMSVLAVVFLLPFVSPAQADLIPQTCRTTPVSDKSVPANIAAKAKDRRAVAVRICRSDIRGQEDRINSVTLMREAWRDRSGVCASQTHWKRAVKGKMRPEPEWEEGDILMMMSRDLECPWPGDKRYVSTRHVSPGVFVELNRFWESMREAGNFDRAIAEMPHEPGVTDKQAKAYELFLEEVKAEFHSRTPPEISEIQVYVGGKWNPSGYSLRTPWKGGSYLSFTIDLTPEGWKVLSIGRIAV